MSEENLNKGHRERLRDRFFDVGLDGFKPHEVLELLLFHAYPQVDTKEKAKKLLSYFNDDLHKVLNASEEELIKAGLTSNAASLVKLVREIFIYQMRLKMIKDKQIKSTLDASDYLKAYFKGKQREEFYVIYLDSKYHIKATQSEAKGTTHTSQVYVREIINQCLKYNASAIILAHNHPSGSLQPSQEDINFTHKVIMALEFFEIKVIDHILVGDDETYSFMDNGNM